jgi:predicted MFS family arabinose efflux permease
MNQWTLHASKSVREQFPNLFASAMLWLACVAYLFYLGMPAFVAQMAADWHYTASQQGLIAMAEVTGNAVGALSLAFLIRGRTALVTFACGLLVLVAGNAAMLAEPPFWLAYGERTFAGIGGGIVAGTSVRYLSLDSRSDTLLPLMVFCQYLGMLLLTSVVAHWMGSIGASLAMCAVLPALSLCILWFFKDGSQVAGEAAYGQGSAVHSGAAWLVLASMLFLYASAGVTWTFLESVGIASGIAQNQLGMAIGAAGLPAGVACLCMPMLLRRGWTVPSGAAFLGLCAAGAAVLSTPLTPWTFAVGATAFFVGWTAGGIAQYAMLPTFDPVGRHIALIPACAGIGSAAGSLAGGYVIDSSSFSLAYEIAAAFAVLAVISLLAANWLGSKRRTLGPSRFAACWTSKSIVARADRGGDPRRRSVAHPPEITLSTAFKETERHAP